MLNRFRERLKGFFFPPSGSPRWARILPYATLGVLTLIVMIGAAYAWDYTNSPEFCGTACDAYERLELDLLHTVEATHDCG